MLFDFSFLNMTNLYGSNDEWMMMSIDERKFINFPNFLLFTQGHVGIGGGGFDTIP